MSILKNLQVQAVPQFLGLCVCVLDDLVWASQLSPRCKGWPQCGLGPLAGGYDPGVELCIVTWFHDQRRGPGPVSDAIGL